RICSIPGTAPVYPWNGGPSGDLVPAGRPAGFGGLDYGEKRINGRAYARESYQAGYSFSDGHGVAGLYLLVCAVVAGAQATMLSGKITAGMAVGECRSVDCTTGLRILYGRPACSHGCPYLA